MDDYRDEHSPDIALLLTLARAVRKYLAATDTTAPEIIADLDRAMKPFEPYAPEDFSKGPVAVDD